MLNTKHIFNAKGAHLVSVSKAVDLNSVVATVDNKIVNLQAKDSISITNNIPEYPYPIKLEEGVIVQDTDQVPFEGKWRSAKEAKAMKAKREKSNNGKSK